MSLQNDLERDQLIYDQRVSPQTDLSSGSFRRPSWGSTRAKNQSIIGLMTVSLVCLLGLAAVLLLFVDPSISSNRPSVRSTRPYFENQQTGHKYATKSVESAQNQLSNEIHETNELAIKPLLSAHSEDCKAMHPTAQSWAEPSYHKRVFIAANLHNNRPTVIDFLVELQRTISAICHPEADQFSGYSDSHKVHRCPNVYVSLYASSSSDPQTQAAMDLFAAYLDSLDVSHTIESRGVLNREKRERIEHLTDVRNAVMMPFASADAVDPFSHILFINDVLFCSEDAVRLLTLTDKGNASMTCGLDFDDIQVQSQPRYYDIWVGRSISGRQTQKTYPFYDDSYSQYSMKHRQPFRVFCCWNGMVAIDASEFRQPNALSFRAHDREVDLRNSSTKRDTCDSSECSHLCEDMWSKHGSKTRILVDPTVYVAYVPRVFSSIRKQKWYHPVDQPRPLYDDKLIIHDEYVNSTSLISRTEDGVSWWCCNLEWKCKEHEVKFAPGVE